MVWLGGFHLEVGKYRSPTTMAVTLPVGEMLKEELKKTNEKMTTFFTQFANSGQDDSMSLLPLTAQISKLVAVPTHQKDGKTNLLGKVSRLPNDPDGRHLEDFDQVIIYPKK